MSSHCWHFRLLSRLARDKYWKNVITNYYAMKTKNGKLCTEPYSQQIIQPAVIKVISIRKHFLLKSTTIFRPRSLPNSKKTTITLVCVAAPGWWGWAPEDAPTGAPSPAEEPRRKPAQPAHHSLSILNVKPEHDTHFQNCHSLLLASARSLPSIAAPGGRMRASLRALLCSLFHAEDILDPSFFACMVSPAHTAQGSCSYFPSVQGGIALLTAAVAQACCPAMKGR